MDRACSGRYGGWVYLKSDTNYFAVQLARVSMWMIDGHTGKMTIYSGGAKWEGTPLNPVQAAVDMGAPFVPMWQVYLSAPCVVKSLGLTTPRPRIAQWSILAFACWCMLALALTLRVWSE